MSAVTAAPRRRRWLRRVLLGFLVLVVVLALVGAGLLRWSVRRTFPQTDGAIDVAVLDAPVEVLRDDLGVAQIYAASTADLYRAQGYVHAQERFWQMDAWRHISAGRTAELFGPDQLEADRFLRTLGWTRVAEQEWELLEPGAQQALANYAEGVNAYLDSRPPRAVSFEYSLLGLTNRGYEPAPWEPVHTLAFLKLMAWDLRGNMDAEIERAVLSQTLPPERLEEILPQPPEDAPVITEQSADLQEVDAATAAPAGMWEGLAEQIAAVDSLTGRPGEGIGSNSWVIGGDRTATGKPILANDPHLGIQMPSIWYQVGLHCTAETADCTGDVAGFSFPGVPGVVIGHNDRIAWGFTNNYADVMDLYVERVNPTNPDQYEVNGVWVDFETTTETLQAADGTTEEVVIRSTRHGPVISGLYGPLDDVATPDEGEYVIALRWTALDPAPTFQALPAMNRAGSFAEFRKAAEDFTVPSQNLVYADVDGTIGYQMPGRVPVRSSGDGTLPVPGWPTHFEWTRMRPFNDLPSFTDPADDVIVTANNPVTPDAYGVMGTEYDHGYRAARLLELLDEAGDEITVEQVQAMQGDAHDSGAELVVPFLLRLDGGDERVARAQQILEEWDFQLHAGSAAGALYSAVWRHLLAGTFHDELPERYRPGGGSRWITVVTNLLEEPRNAWWDDVGTDAVEVRDIALENAVLAAMDELTGALGDDPLQWQWGDLHTATFRNGTLGESGIGLVEDRFNRGPYRVGGGHAVVNATQWVPHAGYEVTVIPSLRMIVDLDDLDRSLALHTPGQSGHAYHPNYTSMVQPWQRNEQRPMPWSREAVEAVTTKRMTLRPPGG